MNDLLGSIKRLGAQAKEGENAMAHLKKTAKMEKSGGGRGDLLGAIHKGVTLKKVSERKQRAPQDDGRQRRMSLHDVMVDAMGGMRGKLNPISDGESDSDGAASSDTSG